MITFYVEVRKLNGDSSAYTRHKVNHALRTLWGQKSLEAAYLNYTESARAANLGRLWIFGKFGRKRAIVEDLEGIKLGFTVKEVKEYAGWARLPNQWNNIK